MYCRAAAKVGSSTFAFRLASWSVRTVAVVTSVVSTTFGLNP